MLSVSIKSPLGGKGLGDDRGMFFLFVCNENLPRSSKIVPHESINALSVKIVNIDQAPCNCTCTRTSAAHTHTYTATMKKINT